VSLNRAARRLSALEERIIRTDLSFDEIDRATPISILQLIEVEPANGLARYLEYINKYGFGLENVLNSIEKSRALNKINCEIIESTL
jgi:hypothetical protein